MASIKSRGNASTELEFINILRNKGIKGWRRHFKILGVRPDFCFPRIKFAIFIHGCFWHGCKIHKTIPVSNKRFWSDKINRNKKRDLRVTKLLRRNGWDVLNIWEHDLKNKRPHISARLYSRINQS